MIPRAAIFRSASLRGSLRASRQAANSSSLLVCSVAASRIPNHRHITTMFPAPKKSKKGRYTLYTLLTAMALTYGYYKYTTWNSYPPVVSELLRMGLSAENMPEGEEDYKIALYCYLEALEEADKTGLHILSDEYTGLQLKVAEMYEKLGMINEARLMYSELSTAYIQALADGKSVPNKLRPHLIQRGLRVALKTAILESATDSELAKMSLAVHLIMAQDEVAKKSPEMAKLIKGGNVQKNFNISLSVDGGASHPEHYDAWQPFRDELFYARDMFVALCIATGDVGLAIQTKLASTEWMAVSGYGSSETLMSFYNVGAIFYLQAEELELRQKQGKLVKPSNPVPSAVSINDLAGMSMANASACFTMVLKLISQLPSKVRREGDIDDVQALATYGLGVIALHKGDLPKASDLLREARLRAKGCGYTDLVTSSEIELGKLDQLTKKGQDLAAAESVTGDDDSINVSSSSPSPPPVALKPILQAKQEEKN